MDRWPEEKKQTPTRFFSIFRPSVRVTTAITTVKILELRHFFENLFAFSLQPEVQISLHNKRTPERTPGTMTKWKSSQTTYILLGFIEGGEISRIFVLFRLVFVVILILFFVLLRRRRRRPFALGLRLDLLPLGRNAFLAAWGARSTTAFRGRGCFIILFVLGINRAVRRLQYIHSVYFIDRLQFAAFARLL